MNLLNRNGNDVHSLVGAYAVDAVDADERRMFEEHLRECESCAHEVAELQQTAAILAADAETAPPAGLRESVLREARAVRPNPPVVTPLRRRRPIGGWLLAAAAALLLVIGGIAWHPWTSGTPTVSAAQRILSASDAERYAHRDGSTVVTVVRSPQLKQAAVTTTGLKAAPSGMAYTMWLIDASGKPVDAGQLPPGASGAVTYVLRGDAASATAAAVTMEPAGTNPAAPSSKSIMAMDFSS
ncbi:anti-sigma factor [Calidifontibacter sp. DB0510]|uniref:Regulator of SigK n=1 Tax=Metallococcus carri TaxID=1656884 RepID=A0A967B252_9MICO|nr:anti-sigma factor [Metallococcus carri]NHN56143.1 anti-sigma factor [Metallococcus carri]NOP38806.1 anti-sigma factor [Calidifontibacter sp. DB2511S]